METYSRFLFEFLDQFFLGFRDIFSGFVTGIQKIFNIGKYSEIIKYYKNDFSIPEWILVAIAILAVIFVVGAVIAIIILAIKYPFSHYSFQIKLLIKNFIVIINQFIH